MDSFDYEAVSKHVWSCSGLGTSHSKLYAHRSGGGRWVKMHVQIMNPPEGFMVDHINGDTLDNRRANLRLATAVDNSRNVVKKSRRHPFKGIKQSGRGWTAHITIAGDAAHLGRFATAEEAARAYDDAARRRFGAFARLNFPRPGEQAA